MAIPSEGLKHCEECDLDKEISEYYVVKIKSKVDEGIFFKYLDRICKGCRTAHQLRRYHGGVREKILIKKAAIKDAVFMAYGGYVCACCGETEKLFLQIDHINNDGGQFRKRLRTNAKHTASGSLTYKWLFDHNFPPGVQVLCSNCNHGKRMNGGVCPHQTTSNDQRLALVGSSEPKRNVPQAGKDMVCSESKDSAVVIN